MQLTSTQARRCTWAAFIALALLSLWWAPLNQDEGWYLMAARRVSEGYAPYRDFAFTQPPVFPSVYRLSLPLVSWLGLLGGRVFTLGCSLAGLGILLTSLRKQLPKATLPMASLLFLTLVALNPQYIQYSTTVKTYALATLFLSAALAFRVQVTSNDESAPGLLCGMCASLACGTRLSLAPFLFVFLIDLLLQNRRHAARGFVVGSLLSCTGIFLPAFMAAPEGVLFGLWEFHAGRVVEGGLLLRAAFLLRWVRFAFPVILLIGVLLGKGKKLKPLSISILCGCALVTWIHLLAPFPYDEYQVILLPALAWVVATELPRILPDPAPKILPVCILLVALSFVLSSPVLEGWFAGKRDRLWWPAKSQSDLASLQQAARELERIDPNGTRLFTADTYLAIESGRDVPSGLEMGPFSYFPHLSTKEVRQLHLVNNQRLFHLLHHYQGSSAALSGYGFTVESPMLTPTSPRVLEKLEEILLRKYPFVIELDAFGQERTPLRIYSTLSGAPGSSAP